MADEEKSRRPVIWVPVLLICFGAIGLFNCMRSPSFEAYRTVDIVKLIGIGMCFGVAIILIFKPFGKSVAA